LHSGEQLRRITNDLPREIHVHAPRDFVPYIDTETRRRIGSRQDEGCSGEGNDAQSRLRAAGGHGTRR
jgi:hypothetical protein